MVEKQLITVTPTNYSKAIEEFTKEESKAADLSLSDARGLVIKTEDQCKLAMESFVIARNRVNTLEEKRTSVTGPLGDVVKAINDLFRTPADKLKEARDLYNKKAVAWRREQEELRLAEEKRLREVAEREERRIREEKEAQERAWREKEAKAKREQEEAERRLKAAKTAEARAKAEEEAERARKAAQVAQDKANERAQQAATVFVAPKTVEKPDIKVAGFRSKPVKWYAKVINPALIPAEYAGRKLWVVDEKALNELATCLKTNESPIPGVRFYTES